MLAKDIMRREIISVSVSATVMQAVTLMLQHGISGLPVVDASGALAGIVTEGDFLRRGELGTQRRRPHWLEFFVGPGRLADEYVHASGRNVREVMTEDVCTVTEATPLEEIVKLMEKHRIKRVPVLRERRLVGIVSRSDLLRAFAALAQETQPSTASDAAIQARIVAELNKQPWGPLAQLNIVVRNGIVELWGAITDERERQAIIVVAENTAGVKRVRDHLVWIEPMSGMAVLPEDPEPATGQPTAG